MEYIDSVVCSVATVSKLRLRLPNAQTLNLAAIFGKKSKKGIWRTYFARKRVELVHSAFAVLDGFADDFKIPSEVLNVLERPAPFLVGPWPTMFDRVVSTFSGEVALNVRYSVKL